MPDDDVARADRADQHLGDERFGALAREIEVEMLDEQQIDPEPRDLALLDAERRQPERLGLRHEHAARMRLEGQYPGRPAPASRARSQACPISAAWPRCSPSKLPIASTAPRGWLDPEPGWRMMRSTVENQTAIRDRDSGEHSACEGGAIASAPPQGNTRAAVAIAPVRNRCARLQAAAPA